MGLDIHNADQIVPEWQNLKVGERVMLAEGFGVPVAVLPTEKALVLHGDTRLDGSEMAPAVRPGEFLAVIWGFYLFETEDGRSRLISRWKADWGESLLTTLAYRLLLEPGAFLMLRRMLLGIKERVEGK